MATIGPPFQGAREGSNGALDLAGFEAGLSLMQKVNAGAPAGLVTHYIAVKAGAPKPDIGTPEAFKRAMLAAKSIAYSRTGVSALVAEYSPSRTRATLVSIMYAAFPQVESPVARPEDRTTGNWRYSKRDEITQRREIELPVKFPICVGKGQQIA
jgi:hypothetical protein